MPRTQPKYLLKMSGNKKQLNVLVSGGGTGGHIFPALSIANELRRRHPESNILFVGAEGRMEMEKVPAADAWKWKKCPLRAIISSDCP